MLKMLLTLQDTYKYVSEELKLKHFEEKTKKLIDSGKIKELNHADAKTLLKQQLIRDKLMDEN
jgi:hypothetical protein